MMGSDPVANRVLQALLTTFVSAKIDASHGQINLF